jgi:hypothetical protein
MEDAPALMDVGLALMAIVGGGIIWVPEFEPHPAIDNKRGQIEKDKTAEKKLRTDLDPIKLITVFSSRTPHVQPRDPMKTVTAWTLECSSRVVFASR